MGREIGWRKGSTAVKLTAPVLGLGGMRVFLRGRAREWLGQERRAEQRQRQRQRQALGGPGVVVGWQEGWLPSGLSSRKVGPAHRYGTHLSRLGGRLPTEWERHRGRPRVCFAGGGGWLGRSAATRRKWLKALIVSHLPLCWCNGRLILRKQQLRADAMPRRRFTMFTMFTNEV